MSPSSSAASALPWLVVAWIATVVVVAALIYLLVRAVLGKTDPQRLPEVLCALAPLLNGVARALTKLPPGLSMQQEQTVNHPTEQPADAAAEPTREAS